MNITTVIKLLKILSLVLTATFFVFGLEFVIHFVGIMLSPLVSLAMVMSALVGVLTTFSLLMTFKTLENLQRRVFIAVSYSVLVCLVGFILVPVFWPVKINPAPLPVTVATCLSLASVQFVLYKIHDLKAKIGTI